mmetsp:Transcript_824/g.2269  ORF Transcript_824/g.2269 Transcript_824/m.2269 type:complete len:292 (+) Transcript_824:150-1025(+)
MCSRPPPNSQQPQQRLCHQLGRLQHQEVAHAVELPHFGGPAAALHHARGLAPVAREGGLLVLRLAAPPRRKDQLDLGVHMLVRQVVRQGDAVGVDRGLVLAPAPEAPPAAGIAVAPEVREGRLRLGVQSLARQGGAQQALQAVADGFGRVEARCLPLAEPASALCQALRALAGALGVGQDGVQQDHAAHLRGPLGQRHQCTVAGEGVRHARRRRPTVAQRDRLDDASEVLADDLPAVGLRLRWRVAGSMGALVNGHRVHAREPADHWGPGTSTEAVCMEKKHKRSVTFPLD